MFLLYKTKQQKQFLKFEIKESKNYLESKQIWENYFLSESCTFSIFHHALYYLKVFHQFYMFHRPFCKISGRDGRS